MSYWLYVIRSSDSQYVGVTKNLKDRLRRHNAGGNKSTKHLKNWKVVYFEKYNTLSEARQEEIRIKRSKVKIERAKNLRYRGVAQPG